MPVTPEPAEGVRRCLDRAARELRAAGALAETWDEAPVGILAEIFQAQIALTPAQVHVWRRVPEFAGRRA